MSITTRQLSHLKEMGIGLWQRKSLTDPNQSKKQKPTKDSNIEQVSEEIINQIIFKDILLALTIEPVDISWEATHINLGLFNWQFVDNDNITFDKNILTTPSIQSITQSLSIKRKLWQIIIQHNLIS
ncbi:MAG: DNA polymerase III subunit psi [Colwelliaceae bacterium]|nr:DNA polymerase III subunit psi [Colwelliaceae bacterium]